ncbi:MAG: hypothetical protein HYR60_19485 [Acidobacteria bacterium]|nr:hypothetical protein [Acidobacteriota bacterium]
MKKVLIGIAVVITLVLCQLISSRRIGTPEAIGQLKFSREGHCGKDAILKGKVLELVGDSGYEIEGEDGVTLRVAVGKARSGVRVLGKVLKPMSS